MKTVVYDVNYMTCQKYGGDSTIRTHILLDYMSFGGNKLQYAKDVLGEAEYGITTISNLGRYKGFWKNTKWVMDNIKMRWVDSSYKNYDYVIHDSKSEWYAGKGFVNSKEIYESGNYAQVPWNLDDLYPKQLEYLQKMILLCKENNCNSVSYTHLTLPTKRIV